MIRDLKKAFMKRKLKKQYLKAIIEQSNLKLKHNDPLQDAEQAAMADQNKLNKKFSITTIFKNDVNMTEQELKVKQHSVEMSFSISEFSNEESINSAKLDKRDNRRQSKTAQEQYKPNKSNERPETPPQELRSNPPEAAYYEADNQIVIQIDENKYETINYSRVEERIPGRSRVYLDKDGRYAIYEIDEMDESPSSISSCTDSSPSQISSIKSSTEPITSIASSSFELSQISEQIKMIGKRKDIGLRRTAKPSSREMPNFEEVWSSQGHSENRDKPRCKQDYSEVSSPSSISSTSSLPEQDEKRQKGQDFILA